MNKDRKGYYLTIDGPDGVGKSTLVDRLSSFIGVVFPEREVLVVRDPDRSRKSSQVALEHTKEMIKLLHGGAPHKAHDEAMAAALCLVAARSQDESKISSVIKGGGVVIRDRWMHSTMAYQGLNPGIRGYIREIHEPLLQPDLSVIIVASNYDKIKERMAARGADKIDSTEWFQEDVRKRYYDLIRSTSASQLVYEDDPDVMLKKLVALLATEIDFSLRFAPDLFMRWFTTISL